MIILMFTLIIVLLFIAFIDVNLNNKKIKNREEFIMLNGLNPLTTQNSRDTLAKRFSFNLLPYYDPYYWDVNDKTLDRPGPDDILIGNRKTKRNLDAYDPIYETKLFPNFSTRLDMNDDLLIDPDRTKLDTVDIVYQGYNYQF